MHLDYSLTSIEERKKLVNQILQTESNPNLEILANYLLIKPKNKDIISDNRKVTIQKNEISYEGLAEKLINGEEGIQTHVRQDKNMLLHPKTNIPPDKLESVKELRQGLENIIIFKSMTPTSDYQAYLIKKIIIELYKDLHTTYNEMRQPVQCSALFFKQSDYVLDGITLSDPIVVEALLCNYPALKSKYCGKFEADFWYLLIDFEELIKEFAVERPHYAEIIKLKWSGYQNEEIQQKMQLKFGLNYSKEYISSLWRTKIPKLIAAAAKAKYEDWLFTYKSPAPKKKCGRCGKWKLATPTYFSKDKTKKDGLYTICKQCRKEKKK